MLAILAVLTLTAITVSATTWEYTNSPEFCGTICHTMPPEYTAYQISPHARVDCVDCHLGQEGVVLTVPRKARELTHVVNALTQSYEPPIYVKSLRPARDTCEQCHNPDKFSFDAFVEIKRYAEDEANTQTRTYLIVKTGGGSQREGLGRGIHWHIENEVWYYTDDPLKQTIPYVREVGPDGQVVEYFDVEAGLPSDFGQQVEGQLQQMDCIDCHTRISHLFRSPADAIDDAIARQKIVKVIPQIKQRGVQLLSQEYPSPEEGLQAIEALEGWYGENYPDFYADNQEAVQNAVEELKRIFTVTVFPNLHIGWKTHPDNAGHREFPGCFRCHDGKHASPAGETVRLECNICHSIPEVVAAGMAAPVLSIDKPGEPVSHLDSAWIARHRYQFDQTCAACHDVSNPGGSDNTSFCSNSACHATEWKFVGLDAPAIRELVEPPPVPGSDVPRPVPHPAGPRTDCAICHAAGAVRPFPDDDHSGYEQTLCTQCHQPTLAGIEGILISPVPHTLEGRRDQCLVCHSLEGFVPYPEDHLERTTDVCLFCHQETGTPVPIAGPIPHLVEGQSDLCLDCHHSTSAVAPYPDDHAGRGVDTCQFCHEAAIEEAAAESESSGIPLIPHTLEDREDCLLCHSADGIKPFPVDDHEERTVEMCQACHKQEG
jgi:nitrate/TMAO reductase-like tetraheme cytochrome c subunit